MISLTKSQIEYKKSQQRKAKDSVCMAFARGELTLAQMKSIINTLETVPQNISVPSHIK